MCGCFLLRPSADADGEPMTRCARLVKQPGAFHATLRMPNLPTQRFGSDLLATRGSSDSMLVCAPWGPADCRQGRLDSCCFKTRRVQVVLIYGLRYPKRPLSPKIMGTWTLRERARCPIAKPVASAKRRERSPGTCSSPLPVPIGSLVVPFCGLP